jgi:predicted GTPase
MGELVEESWQPRNAPASPEERAQAATTERDVHAAAHENKASSSSSSSLTTQADSVADEVQEHKSAALTISDDGDTQAASRTAAGGVARAGEGNEEGEDSKGGEWGREERSFITICLVGDPNMGKSSLMNSVFGRKV